MPNVGFQTFQLAGSRAYFQREPIGGVEQPFFDLGTVDPIVPTISPTPIELKDSDGGVNRVVAQAIADFSMEFDVVSANWNMDNMALLYGSTAPSSFTQSATPLTAVVHYAYPGRLVKLKDASGNYMYGLSAIGTVTSNDGMTTYVLGTDYEVVSLERGIIRMIAGGAFAAAANIKIGMTPRAISASNRLIAPQTQIAIYGKAWIVSSRESFGASNVYEFSAALSPKAATGGTDAYNKITFGLKVLSDPALANPAGRVLAWQGALPLAS